MSLFRTLVQLYLRGGADGLTLCVPIDDPGYHANRFDTRVYHPNDPLAPPEKKATTIAQQVPGFRTAFGLPPAFLGIKQLYDAGKVCFVHAAGSLDPTRSHFDQQKNTELGEINSGQYATPNKDGLGWLGRYLQHTLPVGDGTLRALALSTYPIASFIGGSGVTPAYDPEHFDFPGGALLKSSLSSLYGSFTNPVNAGLQGDLGAIAKLKSQVTWEALPSSYPQSVLGGQFHQAFEVIRGVSDIEIITIDYDNIAGQRWDTHNDQGVFTGTMSHLMPDLAGSISAFLADMATLQQTQPGRSAVVLVYTEFGRTLRENDGKGTDHGRGGVSLLAGTGVVGGQVFTKPGVPWLNSVEDTPVQIDIRDIQAEALVKCLGAHAKAVFPDNNYVYHPYGLIT